MLKKSSYQLHSVNSHAERPATLWSSGNLRSFPAKNVPVGRWKDDFLHDCWRCSVGDTNVLMFHLFHWRSFILFQIINRKSWMFVHSTFALDEPIFLVLFWAWKWSKCSGIYRCNPQPAFWHIINLEAEAIVATRKWGFHREECGRLPLFPKSQTSLNQHCEEFWGRCIYINMDATSCVSWRHSHVLAITICMYPRFPSLHGWYPKTTCSIVANLLDHTVLVCVNYCKSIEMPTNNVAQFSVSIIHNNPIWGSANFYGPLKQNFLYLIAWPIENTEMDMVHLMSGWLPYDLMNLSFTKVDSRETHTFLGESTYFHIFHGSIKVFWLVESYIFGILVQLRSHTSFGADASWRWWPVIDTLHPCFCLSDK